MPQLLIEAILSDGSAVRLVTLGAVALGAILALYGVASSLSERSAASARMAPKRSRNIALESGSAGRDGEMPTGLGVALIPDDADERFEIGLALSRAGFRGKNLVVKYYLVRLVLGLALPLLFLAAVPLARTAWAPTWLAGYVSDLTALSISQHVAVLCAAGFFGPAYWLRGRISERKRKIEEAFPNMLDLIQVGIEAGMGFDQALLKVAVEIQVAAPEAAEEILTALSEIQAGRDRDVALLRMARRTGIDEMSSFVNVVLQSTRFGTPMADALTTYAEEMRNRRELKAQEKANKLPVQMSAVMAALMLPSLIALILAPIIIRYLAVFGGT